MDGPSAVRVVGRAGAGRRTVTRALRGAGVTVAGPAETAAVDVYVFVETLNPDDRAALASAARPTVAVLNKADLELAADGTPLAPAADRCRELRRETGVPVCAFSALLAVAGTVPEVLDEPVLAALRTLAAGAGLDAEARLRLAAELDVVGTALAVAALREGAGRPAIAELLCAVSGIADVLAEIDRAGAANRYRHAAGPARIAAAGAVLAAAGVPDPRAADHLGRAVHWQRYARGPVSLLHRACALDAARSELRQWVRAGGGSAALP